MRKVYNVLFLCTGNSARSIMAEALLQRWGMGKFRGFSAGSQPKGKVHPMTLQLLQQYNFRTEGCRSKSWEEFSQPDAPQMGIVFTVCDRAAGEVCPVWPGQPMTAHWGIDDPDRPDESPERRNIEYGIWGWHADAFCYCFPYSIFLWEPNHEMSPLPDSAVPALLPHLR